MVEMQMKTAIAVLSVMLLLLVSCAAKPAMKGPEPVPMVQPPSMPATEQTTAAQDVTPAQDIESLEQDLGELDQLEQELADLDSI